MSAIFPDLSLTQVLQVASEAAYESIEVMCWPMGKADRRYAGVTHMDVVDLTAVDADRINQQVTAAGIEISALGYYPNLLSPEPAAAEQAVAHLRQVIRASQVLGLDLVNTFAGRDWTRGIEDNWPRFLDTWGPLVEYAELHQVRIGIENCPMLFTQDEWPGGKNLAVSPGIWRRIFADLPSPNLGLNYDPSHMIWQQMDYLQPAREFAQRLFHVHAKDAMLDRQRLDDVGILAEPLQYHTPKIPGLGDVDWKAFVSVLHEAGYQGHVCVEIEDRDYEQTLERRQQALIDSATHLRPLINC
ncbi:MAG: sugar phosphate isomerase/epimerase family protein [Pirellulaceae bacterium]